VRFHVDERESRWIVSIA